MCPWVLRHTLHVRPQEVWTGKAHSQILGNVSFQTKKGRRLGVLSVSQGSCNKLPYTWLLKQRYLFSHSSGCSKFEIKVSVELCSSEGSCWPFRASGGSWQCLVRLDLLHHCGVCLCLPTAFLQGQQSLDLGPTLVRYGLTFNWLYLQRPYFQIRSHPEILHGYEF